MLTEKWKMFCVLAMVWATLSAWAVEEIPDTSVNDIAITTMRNGQIVIIYNPTYCMQLGNLVCNFFRAHEYGHVNLGHPILGTHPQQAEFEADCWAAKNAPLSEVQAAFQHFMASGDMGNWSHGTGIQRAKRIAACAQSRQEWSSTGVRTAPSLSAGDSCQENYSVCMSNTRSVDLCVQEEYPQRCIDDCVNRFGSSYSRCKTQLCLPTVANLTGWRSRCNGFIRVERESCTAERRQCLKN